MDVCAGKQLRYLCKYLIQYQPGRIVGNAKRIGFSPGLTAGVHGVLLFCAGQPRISGYQRQAMRRHIYFRYDGNKTRLRVSHYFPDIFLCIITAIGSLLPWRRRTVAPPFSRAGNARGAYFRKPGQSFYFNAPALVVRKMPVKYVQFVFRHLIDVLLYKCFRKEVPAHIEHQPAPAEAGIIHYIGAGYCPLRILCYRAAFNSRRQQLQQGLHAIKKSLRLVGRNDHLPGRYLQGVPFFAQRSLRHRVNTKRNCIGGRPGFILLYGKMITRGSV